MIILKILCEKLLLQTAVVNVSRAAANKSPVPAMEGILFEAKDSLKLTAFDSKIGIYTYLDAEISELIEAAKLDLGIAGVNVDEVDDPLITMAIKTYCKLHFGETDEYDNLKASYDEQKAQLQMSANYTNYASYNVKTYLDGVNDV